MAAVPWPEELQTLLNEESFSSKFGDTTIRTEMDTGPAKVRRRMTRGVDVITCTINLTTSQYLIFSHFYKVSLDGGVNTFEFNHPITGAPQEFRLAGAPDVISRGGGNFRATMTWEMLP